VALVVEIDIFFSSEKIENRLRFDKVKFNIL